MAVMFGILLFFLLSGTQDRAIHSPYRSDVSGMQARQYFADRVQWANEELVHQLVTNGPVTWARLCRVDIDADDPFWRWLSAYFRSHGWKAGVDGPDPCIVVGFP
jgi:hypothetical protein